MVYNIWFVRGVFMKIDMVEMQLRACFLCERCNEMNHSTVEPIEQNEKDKKWYLFNELMQIYEWENASQSVTAAIFHSIIHIAILNKYFHTVHVLLLLLLMLANIVTMALYRWSYIHVLYQFLNAICVHLCAVNHPMSIIVNASRLFYLVCSCVCENVKNEIFVALCAQIEYYHY